ncbi:MAG: 6-phosphofructokinase [Rhodocyclaceae bacterium]|nr:6-phosphofructokinase [Rhodocyclaceae bacterium]
MSARNALYLQSGGMTAVINASACGVIETARRHPARIGRLLAARHGALGLLREQLFDTGVLGRGELIGLRQTPGGAFGSCRFDLDEPEANPAQYRRLFAVLEAHDIATLFLNGGNGSMQTALQIARAAESFSYPLQVVGIPKTVDNDIVETDCCPGYGSAIKYLASSVREASIDMASMSSRRGRVFVIEVMGRNAGWLAAGCGLAAEGPDEAPQLILLPEVAFDEAAFGARLRQCVERVGWCTVVVAEGVRGADGRPLAQVSSAGRYVQLGGAGAVVSRMIQERFGFKVHCAVTDYLQRSARHLASATDDAQAYAVGAAAVEAAVGGAHGVTMAVQRVSSSPYCWHIGEVALARVANLERRLPPAFVRSDGMHVSDEFVEWARPLVAGEAVPTFIDGLPRYWSPRLALMPARLPAYEPAPIAVTAKPAD